MLDLIAAVLAGVVLAVEPDVPTAVTEPAWKIVWRAIQDAISFLLAAITLYLLGRRRWRRAQQQRRAEPLSRR